jgi:hypothetical protein
MITYTLKRMQPNKPIHLSLTSGASIGKIFTLLLVIQGLLHHYNKQLHVDPLKQKHCSWPTLVKQPSILMVLQSIQH